MKRLRLGTLVLVACTALGAASVSAATSTDDTSFLQTAKSEALGQFALASAAQSKAQDPAVKALAAQVATNADKANKFVTAYAKAHSVTVEDKPSLRATSQYGDIADLKGKDFDQAFAKAIKIDANIALSDYQDEAEHGGDPALKNFAKQQASMLAQVAATADKAE
jgi:putative membrane protein